MAVARRGLHIRQYYRIKTQAGNAVCISHHLTRHASHLYRWVFLVAKLIIASSIALATVWDVIGEMYGS